MKITKDERREALRELLNSKPYISYDELESKFPGVSGMTLRRDIDYFESIGEVIKVRGGARPTKYITNKTDDSLSERMSENIPTKDAIARCAASMLETERSVFIDSGTTLSRMIGYVPNERFIFTTTNPSAAVALASIGQPTVNLVGGRLDGDYGTLLGPQALRFISEINIDIAFMSASGLSARSGCTGGNSAECELKQAVVDKAQKVILLLDHSKIGKSLPYTFCPLDRIDVIVTDQALPTDIVSSLGGKTEIIIAK